MLTRIMAKVCSAIVIGLMWLSAGIWIAFHEHALGRQDFLASQARRFDTHYATPHAVPTVREALSAIAFIALIVVLYELLALAIYKITALLHAPDDGRTKP